MKTTLAALCAVVLSTLTAVASADSVCIGFDTCGPIVDGGVCSPEASAEHLECAQGHGHCEIVPESCEGAGEPKCVGRRADHDVPCPDDGGCSIATHPSRAMQRAAIPSLLISIGVAAMILERRRRGARGR
jgi:hypothetical protein